MERREGPQTPYEVYCYQCHSTFALGTPRCIHCGSRLARSETPLGPAAGADGPEMADPGGAEADGSPMVGMLRRLSGAGVWFVFVLVAIVARMCEGE